PGLLLRLARGQALQKGMHSLMKASRPTSPPTVPRAFASLPLLLLLPAMLAPVRAFAEGGRRTDPTHQDCVAANDKAIAAKHQSKLRAAREQFSVCAAASCRADIRRHCEQQLQEL